MEPLSALSLFCNIVDICDRSIKVCKECREIYASAAGRRTQDEQLLEHLGELQQILNRLRSSLSKLSKGDLYKSIVGPLDRMEVKSTVALAILNEFRAHKPGNVLATVISTIRVARGQGKLDKALRELKQHRDDVHFAIAQSTRLQIEAISEQTDRLCKGQHSIQTGLKLLDARLARLEHNVSEVPDVITEARRISEGVHTELCVLSILGRLGNSNQRYQDVTEADPHTFHWILQDNDKCNRATHDEERETGHGDDATQQAWTERMRLDYENTQNDVNSRLRNWLLGGSGLFHISGKPGSGKSTLMKYLVQHPKVISALEEWARPKSLALGKFFIWKLDLAQNSRDALIRGLLHSIIHHDHSLVHSAFPKCSRDSFEQLSLKSSSNLTEGEISEAFSNLLRNSTVFERFKFCFFVDGLDEIDEDRDAIYSEVVAMLQEWVDGAMGCVKLCVSSRHIPVFESMPVHHRIRLQDLTKYDIINFVQNSLHSHKTFQAEMSVNAKGCQELIEVIARNATGVFLWVKLVVKSVERGLSNADSIAILRERVNGTPKALDELIKSLLDSIEHCHAQMAVLLLALAVQWFPGCRHRQTPISPEISVSACRQFFRAKETSQSDSIDQSFRNDNLPEEFELTPDVIASTEWKLSFQCKGLLETATAEVNICFSNYTGGRVLFLHRSVPESLVRWLPELMDAHQLTASHILHARCWLLWAEIRFLNSSINAESLSVDYQRAMQYIKELSCAALEVMGIATTSKTDLNIASRLLDLAEDALIPAMSLSEQQQEGNSGSPQRRTWNTIDIEVPVSSLPQSYCPFFASPLLAATVTGCYAYVVKRLKQETPSTSHHNYSQHCLEFCFKIFHPCYFLAMECVRARAQIAAALIQTTEADINIALIGPDHCQCGTSLFSHWFNDTGRRPSIFDMIWILFLANDQYENLGAQEDVFYLIESLLELGAIPRAAICVGAARDWFPYSLSPPNHPDGVQTGDFQQVPGAGLQVFKGEAMVERLRMICGQKDGIVTLEKLVTWAKPPNMTAILSLIEHYEHVENIKSSATRTHTESENLQAAVLEKHGVREDGMLLWVECFTNMVGY